MDVINQIDSFVMDIGKKVSFAEDLIGYMEELKNKGTASEIASQTDIVHGRASELLALNFISGTAHNASSVDFTFEAANWSTRVGENVVGTFSLGKVGGIFIWLFLSGRIIFCMSLVS